MGFAPHQQVDQGSQVVNDLVGVCWDQSLPEVERSQARGACSGMLVEGLESGSDGQRVDCRRKPNIRSA